MTRFYPLANECPGVFVFEDASAALELVGDVRDALAERGFNAFATPVDRCVVLPRPFEVRRSVGRTLRDDEYDDYAAACRDVAAFMAPLAIRSRFERLYVFDWDVFTPADHRVLSTLYPTLPGWLGDGDQPSWFGRDENVGPYLWTSFEPPGLQVAALLEDNAFAEWTRAFDAGTHALPVRDLD